MQKFVMEEKKLLPLSRVFIHELVNIHTGQNWDIHWHNGKIMPTEDQYIQMVLNKTSVLPRLCIKVLNIILDVPEVQRQKLITFVESLGIAF